MQNDPIITVIWPHLTNLLSAESAIDKYLQIGALLAVSRRIDLNCDFKYIFICKMLYD